MHSLKQTKQHRSFSIDPIIDATLDKICAAHRKETTQNIGKSKVVNEALKIVLEAPELLERLKERIA